MIAFNEAPVSAPSSAHTLPINPETAARRPGLSPPNRLPIRLDKIELLPASIYMAVPNHTKKTTTTVTSAVLPRPSLKIIASAKLITATNHHSGKKTPERNVRTASKRMYKMIFIFNTPYSSYVVSTSYAPPRPYRARRTEYSGRRGRESTREF